MQKRKSSDYGVGEIVCFIKLVNGVENGLDTNRIYKVRENNLSFSCDLELEDLSNHTSIYTTSSSVGKFDNEILINAYKTEFVKKAKNENFVSFEIGFTDCVRLEYKDKSVEYMTRQQYDKLYLIKPPVIDQGEITDDEEDEESSTEIKKLKYEQLSLF